MLNLCTRSCIRGTFSLSCWHHPLPFWFYLLHMDLIYTVCSHFAFWFWIFLKNHSLFPITIHYHLSPPSYPLLSIPFIIPSLFFTYITTHHPYHYPSYPTTTHNLFIILIIIRHPHYHSSPSITPHCPLDKSASLWINKYTWFWSILRGFWQLPSVYSVYFSSKPFHHLLAYFTST